MAVLRAVESVSQQQPSMIDRRFNLIHCYFPSDEMTALAKKLNVGVDTQSYLYFRDADFISKIYGPSWAERFLGLGSWVRAERIAGGEVDPELRAGFVAILAAGLTTMSGGDGAHEAEAEAHAGRFRAGGAAAGEALPDGGQIGRAEAGAGVAHEDAMMFVIHGQRERDAAATRRVSERVVEQVGDGLIDALAVEQHPT
jgi:hypothetical protein